MAMPLVCECPSLLQHQYHHHHHHHQRPRKKAFIMIFDSTLRPTRTTGEHTTPSCPPNNQNCVKPHCRMHINAIITRMSMSLSVNQVEAPSHIKVVCCGHGVPKQADSTSPNQSFLRTVTAFLCARLPQSPCMCESMFTGLLTVP